jgi:rhodanese-related sulfurtransferase
MPEIRAKRRLLTDYDHIVVVCANGVRSRIAVKDYGRASELANKHFYHVEGGILGFE